MLCPLLSLLLAGSYMTIALQEVAQLCSALKHNTVLKELYASNHALKVSDASCFAQV